MLADKDSIVTVPFRAFLSNGTAPDTGLSNDSIRGTANGAAQFTLTNKFSAVSANAGMYVIVTTASETSVLGTLALWYDQGDFPQHIANLEVVNSNPYSQMSNIAAKTYSGVTVGVNNVDKAVGAISGLSFLPAPGEYSNVSVRASALSGHTPQTGDNFTRLGAPAGASVSADIAAVKVDTAAILVDTGTTLDAAIAAVKSDTAAILVDTGTTLDAAIAAVKVDTAAILVDTGTTLDTAVAAIKVKTDQMVYTVANRLDATINSAVTLAAGTYSDVTIGGVTRVNSNVSLAAGDWSGVTVRASNITVATGGIVAASFGAGAIDAVALATDAGQEFADRVLLRNVASGSDGGRSVAEALYALRNRVAIDGSIGTVYQVNDTSSAWTFSVQTVSTNSGLINSVDPG